MLAARDGIGRHDEELIAPDNTGEFLTAIEGEEEEEKEGTEAKQLGPKADQAVSPVSAAPALVDNLNSLLKGKLRASIKALVISWPGSLTVTWHVLGL
jgi:hypothetical protein